MVCCILALLLLTGFHAQLQAQVRGQAVVFPKDKTAIDMTVEELQQYYPLELRHLELSRNQDELDLLLKKIGERVQAFFQDFSNTSSNEYVLLQRLGYSGRVEQWDSRNFSYLTLYHPNEDKPILEEYRTDKKNRPIGQDAVTDYLVTSGYACLSLYFHPIYHQASGFRYLGRQTTGSLAHVIAFAQKLEKGGFQINFMDTNTGKTVRLPVQGIAWVDPNTYQILRLYVNLLGAGNQSDLTEQTTDVQFSEVRFEGIQKQFWMPREVVVTTIIADTIFRNYHRYSDYKLFAVESDSKIDKLKPR